MNERLNSDFEIRRANKLRPVSHKATSARVGANLRKLADGRPQTAVDVSAAFAVNENLNDLTAEVPARPKSSQINKSGLVNQWMAVEVKKFEDRQDQSYSQQQFHEKIRATEKLRNS